MVHTTKAMLVLALTALIWSSGGLGIKLVNCSPMAITGVRSGLSALVLMLLLRNKLNFSFSQAQLGAALAYALTLLSNVVATKMTTAANAISGLHCSHLCGASGPLVSQGENQPLRLGVHRGYHRGHGAFFYG